MRTTAVAPTEAGVEVGTMFTRSWGYDQTNVDMYRVVALTPKGVKVQQWSLTEVGDDGVGNTRVTAGGGPRQMNEWPRTTPEQLAACNWCGDQDGGFAWHGCPEHGPRTVDAPVETKRLQTYDGGASVYVAVGHYGDHAYKWNGQSMHQTASGWGH